MSNPVRLKRPRDVTLAMLDGFSLYPRATQRADVTAFSIELSMHLVAHVHIKRWLELDPDEQLAMAMTAWEMHVTAARPITQQIFPALADDAMIRGEVDYTSERTRRMIVQGHVAPDSVFWLCTRGVPLDTLRIRPIPRLRDKLVSRPIVAFTSGDFMRWSVAAARRSRHDRMKLKRLLTGGYDYPGMSTERVFECLFRLWAERARGVVAERRAEAAAFFDEAGKIVLPRDAVADISLFWRGWRT